MTIASRGATMAVDWEQRVDFARLRSVRLEKTKAELAASDLGALLLFDPNNLRYVTSTAIGTWEMRLSEDGTNWGAWTPFSSTAAFTLSGTTGMKRVYVQFRDQNLVMYGPFADGIWLQ